MKSSTFSGKGFRRVALASVAGFGLLGASGAFAADSATATASATVVTPISIAATDGTLQFGNFSVDGTTGGTVTISTDGARTVDGSGNVVLAAGTTGAAEFEVTGSLSETYSITAADTTLTGPGTAMALAVVHKPAGGADEDATGTLSGTTGKQLIAVGGTLTVAAAQAQGDYTGTVTVTVEYN